MLYAYLWLRHQVERVLEEERGDIFGQYGFLWLFIALVAIAGLALIGSKLNDFFASIANRF